MILLEGPIKGEGFMPNVGGFQNIWVGEAFFDVNEVRRALSREDFLRQGRMFYNPNDGFQGRPIGFYTTHEGEDGLVLQQSRTKVVHVYREKWLTEL